METINSSITGNEAESRIIDLYRVMNCTIWLMDSSSRIYGRLSDDIPLPYSRTLRVVSEETKNSAELLKILLDDILHMQYDGSSCRDILEDKGLVTATLILLDRIIDPEKISGEEALWMLQQMLGLEGNIGVDRYVSEIIPSIKVSLRLLNSSRTVYWEAVLDYIAAKHENHLSMLAETYRLYMDHLLSSRPHPSL
ncbi:MAG: hypothetical protein GXO43_09625 [Crenarchaeota archaeon]|nr:hypothetical protein [Thermoproteota archaeon]